VLALTKSKNVLKTKLYIMLSVDRPWHGQTCYSHKWQRFAAVRYVDFLWI